MGSCAMQKNLCVSVLIAGMAVTSSYAMADPPSKSCHFKVYNCGADVFPFPENCLDNPFNIHAFNGSDSSYIWAAYEQSTMNPHQYANIHCAEGKCDVLIFPPKIWTKDYCGDLYVTQNCRAGGQTVHKSMPQSCKAALAQGPFTEKKP